MIEPVPYEKVRGVGFYRQFLNAPSGRTSCAAASITMPRRCSPPGSGASTYRRDDLDIGKGVMNVDGTDVG